ncbi:hypothetical protein Tsubulata_046956 [Turnera subulata]|uniref:Uncharacterized protein n=1 Tax=Turnera subulata TaxID=218843 RepID=A0A9Q0F3K6_9ROSI|nr:hypothetical protein Tsubulata_046956 [Turnera subulata]
MEACWRPSRFPKGKRGSALGGSMTEPRREDGSEGNGVQLSDEVVSSLTQELSTAATRLGICDAWISICFMGCSLLVCKSIFDSNDVKELAKNEIR